MTDISMDKVKELRDRTKISVMQCKEALEEADGDMEEAIAILDEKSEKAAAKKAGRDLEAGVVASYIHSDSTVGALVELQCETDFVARNDDFQELAYDIAMHVAAMNPDFVSRDDIPEDEMEAMKAELEEEFADKPDDVREDIVSGKLESKLEETVLLNQAFIKDEDSTIADLLAEATQTFGENTAVGEIAYIAT
jgi:elongation factor Ts